VRAALAAVAALALWGAFEAGRTLAGYSIIATLTERRARATQMAELNEQLRTARARIAELEIAKRVDHEAYTQVEKSLAELQSRLGEQSQELTFYRGIVNPADGIAGMRIQRLQILPGIAPRRYRVRIVLIQAAAKDASVSASADFSVEGQRSGRAASLPLTEISTTGKALSFSFRYFQEAETEVELPADFLPQSVQLEVRPGKGAMPLRATYPWKIDTT
jgi:hypothetical protein